MDAASWWAQNKGQKHHYDEIFEWFWNRNILNPLLFLCCLSGVCKDTVASISEPAQQTSYGLSDGAWMKDARGHGKVIYLTNGHYGNSLLEFRDMDTFKSGIWKTKNL